MIRDPTASESYIALRNALLAVRDDSSAVLSMLSSLSDGGAAWVATGYQELRRFLVQGRVEDGETLGRLIGAVLNVREQGAEDELADNQLHRESMQILLDGISAIQDQDELGGIEHLDRLTEAVYCNESLRWVAWLWMARAAGSRADLDLAKKAIDEALGLAESLDARAKGTALCAAGEIHFLRGETGVALDRLSSAITTFDELGDGRGKAEASLSVARLLLQMGREEDARYAAESARSADADWEQPAVFLSQWALVGGAVDRAEEIIRSFGEQEPRSPDVTRQQGLIASVRAGGVPPKTVATYLLHKDRPPSPAGVTVLEELWRETPGFAPLRELLAWSQLKLDQQEKASGHFEALAKTELDPEVRASVLLGLGCLATRRSGHRPSSARVHAAASALGSAPPIDSAGLRPIITPVVGSLFADLDDEEIVELEIVAMSPPPIPVPPPLPAPALPPPLPGAVEAGRRSRPPTGPIVAGSKAVFTGDLQLFAVSDLLVFLKSSRRTGTLVITSERGIGAIHLRRGMITGSASPHGAKVGDLLLRSGIVSRTQLQSAAVYQRSEGKDRLLGAILVERGMLEESALQKVLVRQIKDALSELVAWTAGRFAFEPDQQAQVESDLELVELDAEEVLLDVLREIDEKNRG